MTDRLQIPTNCSNCHDSCVYNLSFRLPNDTNLQLPLTSTPSELGTVILTLWSATNIVTGQTNDTNAPIADSLPGSATWVVYYDNALQSFQAYQFNLLYCIQTYRTEISNGFETTQILGKYQEGNGLTVTKDWTDYGPIFHMSVPNDSTTYYLHAFVADIVGGILASVLTGSGESYQVTASEIEVFGSTPAAQAFAILYNSNVSLPVDFLSMLFENVATSLSNK